MHNRVRRCGVRATLGLRQFLQGISAGQVDMWGGATDRTDIGDHWPVRKHSVSLPAPINFV